MNAREDSSLSHLLARLTLVEKKVKAAVSKRLTNDPDPQDPFRGLYLSDDQVQRILASPFDTNTEIQEDVESELVRIEDEAERSESSSGRIRLRALERDFGLIPIDIELLLIALAPDIDARFERLYGYLHDDVTRRRASIGLALELAGLSPASAEARARLRPGAPLITGGLLLVEEQDRPFLTRGLRVPDRVSAHLLGDDTPDTLVSELFYSPPPLDLQEAKGIARAFEAGTRLVYLREQSGGAGSSLAVAALSRAGIESVCLDLSRVALDDDLGPVAIAAAREASLRGMGLVAGPIDSIAEKNEQAVRFFADLAPRVVLFGRRHWDPFWSSRVPLTIPAPLTETSVRSELWRNSLDGASSNGLDPASVVGGYRLGPQQVLRAATAARWEASFRDRTIQPDDLRAGARGQNAAGLERLARRIDPRVGWNDIVLPPEPLGLLQELASRAIHREQVLDGWGLRTGGGRGGGINALFAGESGTGKTLAAEVIAHELGLDLYAIDLATVVDKYIGETEKNLERIFSEAEGVNGVLFFDEADALFGKRSEVKDAHDRYANIEVAYLLQRMEQFEGIAILATNLRANLDDAFTRRLDSIVDFPTPDEEHRAILWEKHIGPGVPRADDLDTGFLARSFELSGGSIRNIAVTAAFFAAERGTPLSMIDLIRGVQREYRKLGRLSLESEFGPYYELVSGWERV